MQISVDSETYIDVAVFGSDEGIPLLIINGTGLSWGLWGEAAQVFAKDGYRAMCYDHRGIGASARGVTKITMQNLAADALAVLDGLGVPEAHILGWSLGSCIAQELALAHPDRVTSLILANTWHRTSVYQRSLFTPFQHLWSTGEGDLAWLSQSAASFSPEFLEGADYEETMAMLAPLLPSNREQAWTVSEQWGAELGHDTSERLPSIVCPTLVVAGEQDLVTPAWQGQAVAEAIPRAELVRLAGPGSSHALAWERPQEFTENVGDFLARIR
ncbi:alpha/beta fold hydrolase [Streptomyces sp. NPDC088400]|uniref:alpha/beta fold hydrolase n=1 Tax=Streptomyces sp. NPDC088400 TaxID=3365861 RepID=UPI00381EA5BC